MRIRRHYMALRCIQLYTRLLNVLNADIIFTWKLLCLGLSAVCGFAAVAYFSVHPVFGLMYYAMFFDTSFIYTVIYGKAFKVPERISKTRNAIRLAANGLKNRAEWKMIERQVRSIPSVRVKVGEFHILERTSTPIFLDFVFKSVVNLLVTFK